MNYFDPRTGKALMDGLAEEARKASRPGSEIRPSPLATLKLRLGGWMIARGEKLVHSRPKVA